MSKFLVVDDDQVLCSLIKEWFGEKKIMVECANDGASAIEYLSAYGYDVIILDWNLPDISGIEILKKFRRDGGMTPVLMLTGQSAIDEKELGFDSGADDYLTKPFNIKELAARIKALQRRPEKLVQDSLTVGPLKLEPATCQVFKNGIEVKLSPREYSLMEFLMRHPNTVFTSEQLLNRVWSAEDGSSGEIVRTSIKRLRKRIEEEGTPTLIENLYGIGYKLNLVAVTDP